ncbi:transmembrane protein 53-like [Pecten maximus]|uniref:transmembrane protein 53-like n=1 Tax=Pecten maximus TaxID=6579 RepID=UPI001458B9C7|nr:transmembrane protein 53-like [Pecten maximus]
MEKGEDDLELDYHITFPTPTSGDVFDDDDADLLHDFVDVSGEVVEPVVILIGWAGCKDQYLAKYSKIYEQNRCITIRYIPPREITFFKPHLLHGIGIRVLDLISDFNLEESPVFFHIFSNNGAFVYSEISRILHSVEGRKYSKLKVKGLIVDSAPGKRRILRAAQAFALSTGNSGFMKMAYFIGMVTYLFFMRIYLFLSRIFNRSTGITVNPYSVFEYIKEDKARWPQLYLYSRSDEIIPHTDVEEIVSYRRDKLKLHIQSECWETSKHVSILRDNPEAYATKCWMFIGDCLKEDRDEAAGGQTLYTRI